MQHHPVSPAPRSRRSTPAAFDDEPTVPYVAGKVSARALPLPPPDPSSARLLTTQWQPRPSSRLRRLWAAALATLAALIHWRPARSKRGATLVSPPTLPSDSFGSGLFDPATQQP